MSPEEALALWTDLRARGWSRATEAEIDDQRLHWRSTPIHAAVGVIERDYALRGCDGASIMIACLPYAISRSLDPHGHHRDHGVNTR